LTDLKSAIERQNFGSTEDARFNDVLQRAETNRTRLIAVLDAHHDWQYQHDKLDKLNGFRRNEDFRDQLDNYLDNDSPQLSSMVESEGPMVAQADFAPILGEKLAVLGENLVQLSQTHDLPAFDSMRKTFDDVFYQVDKRTLGAVETSEERVRDLESRLHEMA